MQLRRKYDFSSLTLQDVLEARDNYHVHLSNLDHVVGTAVGKYLIRSRDPDAKTPEKENPRPSGEPRTLFNSVLKPWSWPAVLVFVDNWSTPEELRRKPEAFVPPRLYLPDGRIVPVCVVLAPEQRKPSPSVDLQFPAGLIGGGYPVLSCVQGEERVGTIGCLVTDGHSVFGLTNRHVAGPPGQKSYTIVDGQRQLLGHSDANGVSTIPFSKAYHGWPGEKTISNMDAGLIRPDDLALWTSQVYGLGEMGPLVDANVTNLDLALIGLPVKAYGATSGELKGIVKALFYRYRTIGGVDYVADFLIGPREQSKVLPTRPGDSGTIWFWDMEADESLAGIRFSAQREKILKALRALIPREQRGQKPPRVASLRLQVRDKRVFIAVPGGDVQSVDAAVVLDRPQDEEIPVTRKNVLSDLLEFCQSSPEQANITIAAKGERITLRSGRRRLSLMVNPSMPVAMQWGGYSVLEHGGQEQMEFALATNLANVLRELNVQLFRDWGLGQREYWGKIGHYKIGAKACDLVASGKLYRLMQDNVDCVALTDDAIMDDRLPMNNQARFIALADVPDLRWRSLRPTDAANHFAAIDERRQADGKTLLDLWRNDVATLSIDVWCDFYGDVGKPGVREQGALPFRVWQIYDEMVHSLRQKKIARFVGAAGILAHYVADACQPLHVSWLHHGEREDEGKVHTLYETRLLDRNRAELIAGINGILKDQEVTVRYRGGKAAANATMQLMEYTLQTLPPRDVIAAYNERSGRDRTPYMWDALGSRTIECMAEGTVYLAEMWENAWREGGGDRIAVSKLGPIDKGTLRRLYLNKSFLKSDWLKNMSLGVLVKHFHKKNTDT